MPWQQACDGHHSLSWRRRTNRDPDLRGCVAWCTSVVHCKCMSCACSGGCVGCCRTCGADSSCIQHQQPMRLAVDKVWWRQSHPPLNLIPGLHPAMRLLLCRPPARPPPQMGVASPTCTWPSTGRSWRYEPLWWWPPCRPLLPETSFRQRLGTFFPILTRLISCEHAPPEVQRELSRIFALRLGPLLGNA